jgi:hypothetical protein
MATFEFNDFSELFDILRKDVDELAKAKEGKDGQYYYPDPASLSQQKRRNLVRAVAAFIEAMLYKIRRLTLTTAPAIEDAALKLALSESQIEITDAGHVRQKNLRISTSASFKFTFRAFDSAFKLNCCPDFTEQGYLDVVACFSVRDRLMHPKSEVSVCVSDDEIRGALRGYAWVNSRLVLLLREITRSQHVRLLDAVANHQMKSRPSH